MKPQPATSVLQKILSNNKYSLAILIVLTFVVYSGIFTLGFTNWDDTLNITENENIRSLSSPAINTFFTESYVGMYVPLTMLSYALEYKLFGLNPIAYHTINLLIHLLNIALVYALLKKLNVNIITSFFIAMIWAVLPINVESVAWVSARSNLLSTFFMLLSFYTYVYQNERRGIDYSASVLFFLMALLSKSSAVVLPLVFIVYDYYKQGQPELKIAVRKLLPFFALSVLFAFITVNMRVSAPGNQFIEAAQYTLFQRFFLATYALLFYILKIFIPIKLSIFYPYPMLAKEAIPPIGYVSAIVVFAMGWLAFRLYKTNPQMVLWAGIFFIPLVPVLQLFPFESVNFVADRYAYFSSVGILGFVVIKGMDSKINFMYILAGIILLFSMTTFKRVLVWKSSITLFSDMIKTVPENPFAYHSRGHEYLKQKRYSQALADFDQAVKIKPDYFEANVNRGLLRLEIGNAPGAITDFDKAISINNSLATVYYSRGLARAALLKHLDAISDFDEAEKLGYKTIDLYINRGNAKFNLKRYKKALSDYELAAAIDPNNVLAWDHLGPTKYNLKNYKGAEIAYTKSIELGTTYLDAYRDRGIIRGLQENYKGAVEDFTIAIDRNTKDGMAYYNRGLAYQNLKQMDRACDDWKKASQMHIAQAEVMVKSFCK